MGGDITINSSITNPRGVMLKNLAGISGHSRWLRTQKGPVSTLWTCHSNRAVLSIRNLKQLRPKAQKTKPKSLAN